MTGELVALSVLLGAGVDGVDDPLVEQVASPSPQRPLERREALVRRTGKLIGADQDVAFARQRGLPIYRYIHAVPDPGA